MNYSVGKAQLQSENTIRYPSVKGHHTDRTSMVPRPRDGTHIFLIVGEHLPSEPPGKPH